MNIIRVISLSALVLIGSQVSALASSPHTGPSLDEVKVPPFNFDQKMKQSLQNRALENQLNMDEEQRAINREGNNEYHGQDPASAEELEGIENNEVHNSE